MTFRLSGLATVAVLATLAGAAPAVGQSPAAAAGEVRWREVSQRLEQAQAALAQLRTDTAARIVPLSQEVSRREQTLLEARAALDKARAALDSRQLELTNLRERIKARTLENRYLSNLLGEYVRNLETQLHIVQSDGYAPAIAAAKLAMEDETLPAADVFAAQMQVVLDSMERIDHLIGGTRFKGQAVDAGGRVTDGMFAMIGPHAFFVSNDGASVGQAVERLGSLKPNVLTITAQDGTNAAFDAGIRAAVGTGKGELPLDATLGKAYKVAQTRESLVEHIRKGGVVVFPILAVAALATLVTVGKAVQLFRLPVPPAHVLEPLAADLAHRRHDAATARLARLRGPIADVLRVVLEHADEPKEMIEEIMFERVLETRMRLQRSLPFLAVCAASAPLLGLLGTVTGIISTFKLITAFGSGDIKMLSAGISEALITTELGLYVAIPSLLCHAFLSRRAKALVDNMEKVGLTVLNLMGAANLSAPAAQSLPVPGPDGGAQPAEANR